MPKSTRMVESRCGAVALGRTYLLPPLSSGGASMVSPWLRFHIPLIGRVEGWRAGRPLDRAPFPIPSPSWGPLTINGNGKLDHKVRQASRLVEMLRRTGDASRPLSRISPSISRLREPTRRPLTLNGLDVMTGATSNCSMGQSYPPGRCEHCGGLMVLVMPGDGKGPPALRG